MTGTGRAESPAPDSLFTRARRLEAGRIALVAVVTLAYWYGVAPFAVLLIGVAIGAYRAPVNA